MDKDILKKESFSLGMNDFQDARHLQDAEVAFLDGYKDDPDLMATDRYKRWENSIKSK